MLRHLIQIIADIPRRLLQVMRHRSVFIHPIQKRIQFLGRLLRLRSGRGLASDDFLRLGRSARLNCACVCVW